MHFNQLHGKDGARIKQKRINPRTGDEVPYDRIVRGYEVAPDRWVVLSKEDAQAAEGSRAKVIDVEEFVAGDEIDPVYLRPPVLPGPAGGRRARLRGRAQGAREVRQGRDRPVRAAHARAAGGAAADSTACSA